MPGRVHQNDAPALSLASSLTAGATTIPVNQSITGVETPISYTINSGGANEEIVTLVDKNTSTSPSQFENCVRGCDGTADQSHSSGEVLTHEATARDFVDAGLFGSQVDPRVATHYGHFPEDVANADGYKIASGHQLVVQQGGWKIENGILQNTTTPSIITFPQTQKNGTYRSKISLPLGDGKAGIVIDYEGNNNYLYYSTTSGATINMKLMEMYQGSLTEINGSGNGASKAKHTQEVTYLRNDQYGLRGRLDTESGGVIGFGEHQLTDKYLQNQLNMGYIALNGATVKVSGFVYENILSL